MNSQEQRELIFGSALERGDPVTQREYVAQSSAGERSRRLHLEGLAGAHEHAETSVETRQTHSDDLTHSYPGEALAEGSSPPLKCFPDYELIEEIARGGMGVVYKARQLSLNRIVALKMILHGRLAGAKDVKRFHLEAEAAASLDHPNIVGIYEVGQHDGQPYFTMRYVEGRSLAEVVQDQPSRRLENHEGTARLMSKIARAVHFAHQRGVLHRDIKPANILVDSHGEPHIADFGLAKLISVNSSLTMSGALLGTPSFMAPEQASSKFGKLSAAVDIYSLGAVLYFLLTGRPPFVAETPLDILVQVFERDALKPRAVNHNIPIELERICLRCLEKAPERRYASALALAEDLDAFLRGEPVQLPLASSGVRLRQWVRSQPALAARLLAFALCAVISNVNFALSSSISTQHQMKVMIALGLWALASIGCQWSIAHSRFAGGARVTWVLADAAFLTAILLIDNALESPLVVLYPALIAASGLWFQVGLVRLTTQFCALGYISLLSLEVWRHGRLAHIHWHLIVLAALAITGFVVAYHVHRVSVLGRFCESASSAENN